MVFRIALSRRRAAQHPRHLLRAARRRRGMAGHFWWLGALSGGNCGEHCRGVRHTATGLGRL